MRPSTSRWSGSGPRRSTAVTTSGTCPRTGMAPWSTRWQPGSTCATTGRWPRWTCQTEAWPSRRRPGRRRSGSHVVVAVPLGALKNDLPRFAPPLPPERTGAVRRLGFGRYEKVALTFDEAFWRRAGWSHLVLFPPEAAEPASWVFDLDAFGGGPILVCHTFHSATGHLTGASTTASARWVMGMLSAALGAPCPEPVAVAVTDWADDPYAAGAYTHVPPGSVQRRPRPARDARRRPPALRGRAHAERATRLCRRRHDERDPRGQAAAGHTHSGAGPTHREGMIRTCQWSVGR